jgi:hypothetical protein
MLGQDVLLGKSLGTRTNFERWLVAGECFDALTWRPDGYHCLISDQYHLLLDHLNHCAGWFRSLVYYYLWVAIRSR